MKILIRAEESPVYINAEDFFNLANSLVNITEKYDVQVEIADFTVVSKDTEKVDVFKHLKKTDKK